MEMITAGGEEGFVSRMILESLELRERCQCVPSFSLPKYGLTLKNLPVAGTPPARQTVVADIARVAPPRLFGTHRRKPSVLGTGVAED